MKPIGALAARSGLIDGAALEAAHRHAHSHDRPVVDSMVGGEHVSEVELARIISEELRLPRVNLEACRPDVRAASLVSADACRKYLVFPVELEQRDGFEFIVLAMADPLNTDAIRVIYRLTGLRVRPLVAQASDVCAAIARTYQCAFEPLMGMGELAPSQSDDVTFIGEAQQSQHFFDQVENLLGPYLCGDMLVPADRNEARRILSHCLKASTATRDKLLLSALLQLVDRNLIDPSKLLSSSPESRGG